MAAVSAHSCPASSLWRTPVTQRVNGQSAHANKLTTLTEHLIYWSLLGFKDNFNKYNPKKRFEED